MNQKNEISFTYNDVTIRNSDILCLNPNQWLNDICIGFYYEILKDKFKDPSIYLIDPSVIGILSYESEFELISSIFYGINFSKIRYIFIPCNDNQDKFKFSGGSHWTLLLFDCNDQYFYYYDSMQCKYIPDFIISIKDKIHSIVFNEPKLLKENKSNIKICKFIPKQENSYDCGIYLLEITEILLEEIINNKIIDESIKFEQINTEKISQKRKIILQIIEKLKSIKKNN